MESKQMESKLVPDVFERLDTDKCLRVEYGDCKVEKGIKCKEEKTKNKPKISWDADQNKLYTVACVDPDAPKPECLHWLCCDIKGDKIETGCECAPYLGPCPSDNKTHRYVFAVFEQPKEMKSKDKFDSMEKRQGFRLREWIKKNDLKGPLAVNYFIVDSTEGGKKSEQTSGQQISGQQTFGQQTFGQDTSSFSGLQTSGQQSYGQTGQKDQSGQRGQIGQTGQQLKTDKR